MPSPSSIPTFQCNQCGRRMNWSPALAGKRGRCKCGATVQVPATVEAQAGLDAEEDLLSALETPIRPVVQPTQYAHQPVLAAPLAYARQAPPRDASAGAAMHELAREFYIPAVVLAVGFGCILGWLAHHGRFIFAAVVIVMFLAGLLMIGKTVALSLFAWFLARSNGGSFGHPLGTILKIAGLVVTLDAATLWALSGMVATGAITRRGGLYPIHTIVLLFKDPQEWETSIAYGRKNVPVSNLLDKLSVAGASRLYVDTAVARAGVTRIYVDLPETPQKRDACFAVAVDWTQSNPKTIVMPQPPTAARFMQIDIMR